MVSEKSKTSNFTGGSNFSGGKAYAATELDNQLKYKIKYSLKFNHTGNVKNTIDVNQTSLLTDKLILKPASCSFIGCIYDNDNSGQQYVNEVPIIVKFTPTTCTFKNQEISAPDISYHEIDSNGFTAPRPKQPELQCSSITGVATSNIHYHFESISATQGDILKNDLETQQGSAGEVGFELTNNNKAINFPSSEKFTLASRGSALLTNTVYPLNLQLRYARYGNKVFAGRVQSRVKVVVDYD
ncbi:fimbrial protein [Pseudescherichia sp.]|uniref:fimbrial protein n=1 Tax=Pseudescherichia sp. TaxID=2055881 RepID=UPI0028973A03|nr:fimbrial protein [Pseudescherichia sp.]